MKWKKKTFQKHFSKFCKRTTFGIDNISIQVLFGLRKKKNASMVEQRYGNIFPLASLKTGRVQALCGEPWNACAIFAERERCEVLPFRGIVSDL